MDAPDEAEQAPRDALIPSLIARALLHLRMVPLSHTRSHKRITRQGAAPQAPTQPPQISLDDLLAGKEASDAWVQTLDSGVLFSEHTPPERQVLAFVFAHHLVDFVA